MKAAVISSHGNRDVIAIRSDYPVPQPAADEVLVRVHACALNAHDIMSRRGIPGIRIPLPLVIGSDISGEIAQLGAEVRDWQVGERVLVDPLIRSERKLGLIGEIRDGGRAELVAVPAALLHRVPASVSLDAAAALPVAYGTAYRMLVDRGQVCRDEKVLILGASGGVGVACVQIAKLLGAEVIACASSEEKLTALTKLGADHVIDYRSQGMRDSVHALFGKPRVTGAGGVDVAVNFTGGDTWEDTQRCVRLRGRILTCGATAGFTVSQDMRYLWTLEHQVIGSNGWTEDNLRTLVGMVESGRLDPVIGARLPLEQAAEADRRLEERAAFGKILLVP